MNNAESQTARRTDVNVTHFVSFFHFSLIAEADEVFLLFLSGSASHSLAFPL